MSSPKTPSILHWRYLLLIYVVLLLLSAFFRSSPTKSEPITYVDYSASQEPLLIYLSDADTPNSEIILHFDSTYSKIVFPAFNASYEKQADSLFNLVSRFNASSMHVIGEGTGGSVAVHLASKLPDSIESLTLISAHGIEELELLGGYHLNQAIYSTLHTVYQLLDYGIPHFGYWKSLRTSILRTSIQADSDQRVIRNMMLDIDLPVLIIHTEDARIRKEVSVEHQRIMPQSELQFVHSGTNTISTIRMFIQHVESGKALSRNQVDEETFQKSLEPFVADKSLRAEGKALIILMLVIIFSTLISEDLTCIGTGLLIARGFIGFFPGVAACLIGIFVGDILLYLAGRWLASGTLHRAPVKWFISEKDIERSYHWFQAKGPMIIIASRFIPGSRLPTYFSAGAIGASFWMFIFYFGVASIIWTPILVGLAVLVGQEMMGYFSVYQDYALWVLIGFFTAFFLLFKLVIPSFTYKGRRLLVGSFKRFWNWEFWSPFVLYTPVVLFLFTRWIKFRSISLVTLVNPEIEAGGFIKESKSGILESIQAKEVLPECVVLNSSLSDFEKIEQAEQFMMHKNLTFPVVLKPDIGERGKGVHIAKSRPQLERALKNIEGHIILQEYVGGEEFGVFYMRFPDEANGNIFSLTKKEYLSLEGDGVHTLESLILKDPRAVCLANIHFEQHTDELYRIPPKGKRISLVEIGTHSRGAIFKDAAPDITPALVQEIDRISKSMPNFYFGRFDIKTPSTLHLKEGNAFKVMEVNGLTSESTHIYDPRYTFFYAVKTLCRQWALAYEIAENVKEKHPHRVPVSLKKLIQKLT
jgi:membrane protein DedA with SNARE-associated domain